MGQTGRGVRGILAAGCGVLVASCLIPPAQGAEAKNPANPFKAWDPWTPTRFSVDYPVVLRQDGGSIQLWFTAGMGGMVHLFGFVGPNLGRLPDTDQIVKFGANCIQGYDRPLNGIPVPIITRASCAILKDGTHIALAAIGPKYEGGSELYPALFVSPDGKPGTWKHLGPPAGDPAAWLAKARERNGRFRIEGGSIFELPDGKLRMYIHGFKDPAEWGALQPPRSPKGKQPQAPAPLNLCVNTLCVADAPSVDGKWVFLKDSSGRYLNVIKGLAHDCDWIFPNVMKIGDHGYMATGSNKWPPTSVFAAFSVNGIHFDIPKAPGKPAQPVLVFSEVSAKTDSIKILRGAFNPETGLFEAVSNISAGSGWHVHHSKTEFDVGVFKRLSPAASKPEFRGR